MVKDVAHPVYKYTYVCTTSRRGCLFVCFRLFYSCMSYKWRQMKFFHTVVCTARASHCSVVVTVTWSPANSAWPLKYRVEWSNGTVLSDGIRTPLVRDRVSELWEGREGEVGPTQEVQCVK